MDQRHFFLMRCILKIKQLVGFSKGSFRLDQHFASQFFKNFFFNYSLFLILEIRYIITLEMVREKVIFLNFTNFIPISFKLLMHR